MAEKEEEKTTKNTVKKGKIGKRSRRDYVGEEIEQEEEPKEPEKEKKKGFLGLFEKVEKQVQIYQCPGCPQPEDPEQMVAFRTMEELQIHLHETHDITMIPEDVERCKIQVNKSLSEKILKGMKEAQEKLDQEASEQQKRFEAALSVPPELEPENIISEGNAKSPGEVYSKTIETITSPPGMPQKEQDDEYYSENIADGIIEITMNKRFPLNNQVLAAMQVLKMFM